MRYYYTDPLAAAWMFQKHGVLIDDFTTIFAHHSFHAGLSELLGNKSFQPGEYRFYIHPSSIRLLEPQVGDLIYSPSDLAYGIVKYIADEGDRYIVGFENDDQKWSNVFIKMKFGFDHPPIIKERQGIVFMWPDEELQ